MKQAPARIRLDDFGFKTDAERIITYLQGPADDSLINQHDKVKIDRCMTCRSLLVEHRVPAKVVRMLMHTFDISEPTAWRVMRLTDLIFGRLSNISKDMRRAIADEQIRKTKEAAKEAGDLKTMATCDANYIKLHNLDKEEGELPDTSHFDFHPIIVASMPEQVGIDPLPDEELLKRYETWYDAKGKEVKVAHQRKS